MEPFTVFPNPHITTKGIISNRFLALNIATFWDACSYIHDLPYGYNSNPDDLFILFKEGFGSCTTKHAVIATLGKELGIAIDKYIGIYAMTEDVVTGASQILTKYRLPYLPMNHCFLVHESHHVDLTEGNNNGKNQALNEFLYTEKVIPNISEKNEYLLYKKAVETDILKRNEMQGISLQVVLKARSEGIMLLRTKIPQQYLAFR